MRQVHLLAQNKACVVWCLLAYVLICFTWANRKPSTAHFRIAASISNWDCLLGYFIQHHVNLLLIDPVILDHLVVRRLPFEQLDTRWMTLGIAPAAVQFIERLASLSNFSVTISRTADNASMDHIFVEQQQHIIQLAVLHPQNSYFLIRANAARLPANARLTYGDTPRILDPFDTESFRERYLFDVPRNASHFLWLYGTSEFIQCDRTLADQMEREYHLVQNRTQLDLTISPMRSIATALDGLEKHHWLAGGTLLGWYRHCGLIPYTQDVDFGLFAEEYDERIRQHFLGHPTVYLWGALGLVNDSLEFRLFTGHFTFDLFWAYREGNHRWCGYQVKRVKYRRILPLLPKLCSCDLFGYRFSVPCSPVGYLDTEYGRGRWAKPLEKNYAWRNVKYHSVWDDRSWVQAVRLYTREGKPRRDKYAVDWIANQYNHSATTILSLMGILSRKLGGR